MKFARRAEGIKAARAVFKVAREDARISHHIYVAAALMEYFTSKVSTQYLGISTREALLHQGSAQNDWGI